MLFSIKNKCIEIKKLFQGPKIKFECELLHLHNRFGILKYTLDKDCQVDNINLKKGIESLGYFWESRPYNIYQWYDKNNGLIASYFNISDKTKLKVEEFYWRDLKLDILVHNDNSLIILDKEELNIINEPEILRYIQNAEKKILRDYKKIIAEINVIVKCYQLN